jgi:hypothetical protein
LSRPVLATSPSNALNTAGLPVAKVNPRRARRFAEAVERLIKTDRVDAAALACMGELLDLPERPAPAKIIVSVTLAAREGCGVRVRKFRGDNKNSAKTAITRLLSICQFL